MKQLKIGEMIDYYRKQKKLTLKELGNKLDKGESTVSKWISGASTPLAKDLSIMTQIFEIDIETLMYGPKEDKKDDPNMVVAAHLDDNLTEEEMDEVRAFINFVKSKRK